MPNFVQLSSPGSCSASWISYDRKWKISAWIELIYSSTSRTRRSLLGFLEILRGFLRRTQLSFRGNRWSTDWLVVMRYMQVHAEILTLTTSLDVHPITWSTLSHVFSEVELRWFLCLLVKQTYLLQCKNRASGFWICTYSSIKHYRWPITSENAWARNGIIHFISLLSHTAAFRLWYKPLRLKLFEKTRPLY